MSQRAANGLGLFNHHIVVHTNRKDRENRVRLFGDVTAPLQSGIAARLPASINCILA